MSDSDSDSDSDIDIWGVCLPRVALSSADISYLEKISQMNVPSVQWIWQEMDRVWDELGLDNFRGVDAGVLGEYYSHPIWVVNGVFSAIDPVSSQHRQAIAEFVSGLGARRVADYGGGFGELALRLSAVDSGINIEIVEPYPSGLGKARVGGKSRIGFVAKLSGQYDCVVAQDVLEHVENPLHLVEQMVEVTKIGGYMIFANCFYPFIKCHMPSTFYLRHTYSFVVRGMGLQFIGRVGGARHALIFRRVGEVRQGDFIVRHIIAKVIGSALNLTISVLGAIYSTLVKRIS